MTAGEFWRRFLRETGRGEDVICSEVFAFSEGEDQCLAAWRETHRRIFTEEGRRLGYAFTDETRVVFEDFRVIWQG